MLGGVSGGGGGGGGGGEKAKVGEACCMYDFSNGLKADIVLGIRHFSIVGLIEHGTLFGSSLLKVNHIFVKDIKCYSALHMLNIIFQR